MTTLNEILEYTRRTFRPMTPEEAAAWRRVLEGFRACYIHPRPRYAPMRRAARIALALHRRWRGDPRLWGRTR